MNMHAISFLKYFISAHKTYKHAACICLQQRSLKTIFVESNSEPGL